MRAADRYTNLAVCSEKRSTASSYARQVKLGRDLIWDNFRIIMHVRHSGNFSLYDTRCGTNVDNVARLRHDAIK